MTALSVQDSNLSSNDRVTLSKLLKLGFHQSNTAYTMDAAALGSSGLSTNGLVALARASVPRLLDAEGVELRPKTFVALQVTVHCTGSADFMLNLDLVA